MLKTNSKQAHENIKNYIIDNFTPETYTDREITEWKEIAAFILECFHSEKYHLPEDFRYYHGSERAAFADWCAGLPAVLDTCYFYNRSAVADLGEILEQTAEQREKYDESDAEQLLTYLIYRELIAA